MPNKQIPEERSAADYMPDRQSLPAMRDAADKCRGCDLYKGTTQAVFGEGASRASVLFVGEQPGDVEDRLGHPFVGPAGKLLHKALAEAGIDESECYFTNAVKHFKYEWRGKRRIHNKPRRVEVMACLPWLLAEIKQVKPQVIVCLGATAAQALMGTSFKVTRERGQFLRTEMESVVFATIHPSAILRAPDDDQRHERMREFVADLMKVEQMIHGKRHH